MPPRARGEHTLTLMLARALKAFGSFWVFSASVREAKGKWKGVGKRERSASFAVRSRRHYTGGTGRASLLLRRLAHQNAAMGRAVSRAGRGSRDGESEGSKRGGLRSCDLLRGNRIN